MLTWAHESVDQRSEGVSYPEEAQIIILISTFNWKGSFSFQDWVSPTNSSEVLV